MNSCTSSLTRNSKILLIIVIHRTIQSLTNTSIVHLMVAHLCAIQSSPSAFGPEIVHTLNFVSFIFFTAFKSASSQPEIIHVSQLFFFWEGEFWLFRVFPIWKKLIWTYIVLKQLTFTLGPKMSKYDTEIRFKFVGQWMGHIDGSRGWGIKFHDGHSWSP